MSVLNIYAVYVFENFNHPPKNHLKFPLGVKKIEDFFVFFTTTYFCLVIKLANIIRSPARHIFF